MWPRWVGLVLAVLVISLVFLRLAEWQVHRLEYKRERNTTVALHENEPVRPWQQVMNRTITDADQWQRVSITGSYDTSQSIEVRYRNVDDAQGSEWVAPLRTSDGQAVLIDRGFTTRDQGKAKAPPSGTVTIIGYVRRNEQTSGNATTVVQQSVRLINSDKIAEHLGYRLANGYIQQISTQPPDPGLTPVGLPSMDEGPHKSYAIQWVLFTGVALIGVALLIRNDIRTRRKARAKAARLAASDQSPAHRPGGGSADDKCRQPDTTITQPRGEPDPDEHPMPLSPDDHGSLNDPRSIP